MSARLAVTVAVMALARYGEAARIERALAPAVAADYVAGGGITASTTKAFVAKGVPHMHRLKFELLKGTSKGPSEQY